MSSVKHWIGLVISLATALAAVLFGLSIWWSHGERDDIAAWAKVQHETAWLVAILEPESEGPTLPCADSTKLAVMGGNVASGDSAQGRSSIRAAQSRLLHEGWSLLGRERLDVGDGLGIRNFDRFDRTISGRTITVTFVGSEQRRGPADVYRPPPELPAVTITMEPKFCGL